MKLVMFDIDGTLTRTFSIDSDCYVQAVEDVAGFESINTDWASYRCVTDSGILEELYRTRLNRSPSRDETAAIQDRFFRLLEEAATTSPGVYAAMPGANAFLARLREAGFGSALASGGWQRTARLKLDLAQLDVEGVPAAFADDAHAREEIMRITLARAAETYRVSAFDALYYFGDGVWDAKATAFLGWRFIGLGTGVGALRLREMGASEIFADYLNPALILECLKADRP